MYFTTITFRLLILHKLFTIINKIVINELILRLICVLVVMVVILLIKSIHSLRLTNAHLQSILMIGISNEIQTQ